MDAMRKYYGIAAAMSLALGLAFWSGNIRAQQQEGAAAKVGEKIDEVGRRIKERIEKAEDAVREGFHKSRDSVHSMGVVSRVYGRLHWDKALQASTLTVKAEDGVVTLRGDVPSKAARSKAVTLAAETIGVTKVVDELNVLVSEPDETRTSTKPQVRPVPREIDR
jgi:hyperosmotically inducible periplasmic protein